MTGQDRAVAASGDQTRLWACAVRRPGRALSVLRGFACSGRVELESMGLQCRWAWATRGSRAASSHGGLAVAVRSTRLGSPVPEDERHGADVSGPAAGWTRPARLSSSAPGSAAGA